MRRRNPVELFGFFKTTLIQQILTLGSQGFLADFPVEAQFLEFTIDDVGPHFAHSSISIVALIVAIGQIPGTRFPMLIDGILLEIHVRSEGPVFFYALFTEHEMAVDVPVVMVVGSFFIMDGIGKGVILADSGLLQELFD